MAISHLELSVTYIMYLFLSVKYQDNYYSMYRTHPVVTMVTKTITYDILECNDNWLLEAFYTVQQGLYL